MALGLFLGQDTSSGQETAQGLYVKVMTSQGQTKFFELTWTGRSYPVYLVINSPIMSVSADTIVDVLHGPFNQAVKEFIEKGYHKRKGYYLVTPAGDMYQIEE